MNIREWSQRHLIELASPYTQLEIPDGSAFNLIQHWRQLCDHYPRISARSKDHIAVIPGRRPVLLLLLTDPVSDRGVRHEYIGHQLGVGRHVTHHTGNLQLDWAALAGIIRLITLCAGNRDGLSERIGSTEKLPGGVFG